MMMKAASRTATHSPTPLAIRMTWLGLRGRVGGADPTGCRLRMRVGSFTRLAAVAAPHEVQNEDARFSGHPQWVQ